MLRLRTSLLQIAVSQPYTTQNGKKYLPTKLQVSKRTTRKDNEMIAKCGGKTPLVITKSY